MPGRFSCIPASEGVIDQRGGVLRRPSRPLVVADVLQNIEKNKFSRLGRAQQPDGQTPLDVRGTNELIRALRWVGWSGR